MNVEASQHGTEKTNNKQYVVAVAAYRFALYGFPALLALVQYISLPNAYLVTSSLMGFVSSHASDPKTSIFSLIKCGAIQNETAIQHFYKRVTLSREGMGLQPTSALSWNNSWMINNDPGSLVFLSCPNVLAQ